MNKLFVSLISIILLDLIYISLIKDYFLHQITVIQKFAVKINIFATILCYLLLTFGINYFILNKNRNEKDAFILGIVIYGVYETTNKALFSKWSWLTVAIDTLWGGTLFALTTFIINKYV
jgi:uncharacterized membrane protein